MYYIVQDKLYKEDAWETLIDSLERLELKYEIVSVIPFLEKIEFKTDRKDVFCFGALLMSRLSPQYGWKPGCLITPNHDFNVYKNYYKDNLLNYDSKIIKFSDDFEWDGDFFARPTLDSKVFTGTVYSMNEWVTFRDRKIKELIEIRKDPLLHISLDENTEIQISSLKNIQKEFRFYIVGGEIITSSLYRMGDWVRYDSVVDEEATEYCKEMIKLFQLADAFTMDICLTDGEWKIIECGSLSCAGLYHANIPKLLMSIEDYFNNVQFDSNQLQ